MRLERVVTLVTVPDATLFGRSHHHDKHKNYSAWLGVAAFCQNDDCCYPLLGLPSRKTNDDEKF